MSKYIEDGIAARTPFISENMGGGGASSSTNPAAAASTLTATTSTSKGSQAEVRSETEGGKPDEEPEERCEKPSLALMKLKTYLSALRPWSLSASLVPTMLGSAIAYRTSGIHDFNVVTLVLTIFTIISVHCAGNVVNTYFDFVKGIDNRKSDDRTLVDHILSKDEVSCDSSRFSPLFLVAISDKDSTPF